jgi:outer membrane immunogenic protein
MKKLATAIAAIALMGTPAFAADLARKMPVKASPAAPPPIYNWTGFYVGGNIGYSWGKASGDVSDPNLAALAVFATPVVSIPTSLAQSVKPRGVIGGAQIGYNYQINPNWVVGLEGDLQLSDEHDGNTQTISSTGSRTDTLPGAGTVTLTETVTTNTTFEGKISWFDTIRARAGILITPTTLLYGTGGFAFGGVKLSGSATVSDIGTACPTGAGCITVSNSGGFAFTQTKTKTGWTLGGGVEGILWGNWTWKAEYLYLDLGSESGSATDNSGGIVSWNAKFTDNIARVGLNYQFH